jgi:hypothetical protein
MHSHSLCASVPLSLMDAFNHGVWCTTTLVLMTLDALYVCANEQGLSVCANQGVGQLKIRGTSRCVYRDHSLAR